MTLLRNVIAFCLIILFVAGCGKNITVSSSNADAKTIEITDSIGRSVRFLHQLQVRRSRMHIMLN